MSPIEDPKATWQSYALECEADLPIHSTIALLRALQMRPQIEVHLVSGRDAAAKDQTLEWLERHEVPFTRLVLSRGADHATHKLDYARDLLAAGCHVLLHIDDWPSLVEPLAELGIPCMIVDPRYYIERSECPGVVSTRRSGEASVTAL